VGKSSVVHDIVDGGIRLGNNLTTGIPREIAQAVGADGVVKGIDKWNNFQRNTASGVVSLAYDEKGKAKRASDEANKVAKAKSDLAADAEKKRVAAAESDRIEGERMSAGSKSRTLLTGPAGLEDNEDSQNISRRTLSAR
jgi:hypothetical protein